MNKQQILDNINHLNTLNRHGVSNVRNSLSPQALIIIEHMQILLDVVLEDYNKLKSLNFNQNETK